MKMIVKGLSISLAFFVANLLSVPAQAEGCGVVTTKTKPLNIRHSATLNTGVIFKASPGSALSILETRGSWYKVKLNNGWTGYASSQYVSRSGACGVVTRQSSPLSIRAGMGGNTKVVTRANPGSAVRILETHASVYKVKLNGGRVGYASRNSIKAQQQGNNFGTSQGRNRPNASKNTSSNRSGVCGLVVTKKSPLAVHATADKKAGVIKQASKDSAVLILGTVGSWYQVKLNDGTVGYASRAQIKREDELGGYTFCGIVTTKNTPLNIRAGLGTHTNVVGRAQKGTALLVLNIKGKWYQVKLNDGTIGYGSGDYIRYSGKKSR